MFVLEFSRHLLIQRDELLNSVCKYSVFFEYTANATKFNQTALRVILQVTKTTPLILELFVDEYPTALPVQVSS